MDLLGLAGRDQPTVWEETGICWVSRSDSSKVSIRMLVLVSISRMNAAIFDVKKL